MGLSICESCPRSCCQDFKLTQEINNPQELQETLKKYPFIRKTGKEIVLDQFGNEKVVGVYNCDRFNEETKTCENYTTEKRPPFCINSGKIIAPTENVYF